MKSLLMTLPLLAAFTGTAVAGPDCSDSKSEKPLWEIVKVFEEAGGKVQVAKVTNDKCFEIYGYEGEKRVEIYYDPSTGNVLEREEG